MVDRRAISPRQFAENMYVPEENADFQALREDPEYNKKLIDAALQASMVIPVGGAIAGSAQAAKAVPGMVGRAGQYARGLETAASGISPAELAIIQAKYPGRFIDPKTGFPQSIANPLSGRTEWAMGARPDAFAAAAESAPKSFSEAGAIARDYLTKPRPVVNPETGNVLQNVGYAGAPRPRPDLPWGVNLAEWTPGQRAAQTAVVGAPIAAATYALSPSAQPVNPGRGSVIEQPGARYAADVGAGRGMVVEQPGERYAADVGAGRGFINEGAGDRAAYERSQALDAAKQRMAAIQSTGDAAGLPPARPTSGGLANLFSGKDYQSKGGELRQDGKINWGDPESAADFFRASKAAQETPDASGMATGGAAKPHKDAALHKALDIIAHMLGRR